VAADLSAAIGYAAISRRPLGSYARGGLPTSWRPAAGDLRRPRRVSSRATDTVQRLTGWAPQTFATWAATYADAFRSDDSVVFAG
jgi:hypothetical protein